MKKQVVITDFCHIELHYFFNDYSHIMDARLQNKCELDFIRLLESVAKTCGLDIIIEAEPKIVGGLLNRYRLVSVNNSNSNTSIYPTIKVALLTAIFLAPTTVAVNGINEVVKQVVEHKMNDKILDSLEKEKLESEIELIRLNIEEKKKGNQTRQC